jgi:hypothetical protein
VHANNHLPAKKYIIGTTMTNKIKPKDNTSNMNNPNKGTPETNKQYDKNQGNRGKQKNPNQK